MNRRASFIAIVSLSFFLCEPVLAQTSTNYRIPSDVQAAGGGDAAKSTNYVLMDTIGEPNIGQSGTPNYTLNAGYRQTLQTFISLSGPSNLSIGTIAGTGQKTASGSFTVTTDATAGYSLSWQASAVVMDSGTDTIAAFTPTVANVPDTWTINATDSEWGGRLRNDSTDSAAEWGNDGAGKNWLNVATSSRIVVSRTTRTAVAGSSEYLEFRAEIGASKIQLPGTYNVTVTMTAVSL